MHVLICPGAFADSLSAVVAAETVAAGWRVRSDAEVTVAPMSDGGSGLVDAVAAARGGEMLATAVPGPAGREVPATVLFCRPSTASVGGTAVIEAGQVFGAHLVCPDERAAVALTGTSVGLGRLLRHALDTGASRIVIGLGPAAVHDAGAGMLAGLGLPAPRLRGGALGLDNAAPGDLAGLADVRRELAGRDLVVACATDEPLVGLNGAGAALVQRAGLAPERAQSADRAVAHFAHLLDAVAAPRRSLPLASTAGREATGRSATRPYTGAGGGAALALQALGGRLLDGASVVADIVGLPDLVAGSDLVVTGCGCLDAEAVHAGVVAAVGENALRHGIPVVALAGEVQASRRELARIGVVGSYALRERLGPFAEPGGESADDALVLARRAARVAATWSPA